jgi:hypothetical protein
MSTPRILALPFLALCLLSGCGGSTPEVDTAVRIQDDKSKPAGSPEAKAASDAATVKDVPKE